MSGVARFDCYPSDFLNGIVGMTADQIAAYTVLMMVQYDRGGPVQYVGRERELSVRTGLPKGRLAKAIDDLAILGKLHRTDDGAVYNTRTAEELGKISERISKNIENSLIGGNATREKWDAIRNKNNDGNWPDGKPNGKPKQGPNSPPSPPPIAVAKATGANAPNPRSVLLECLSPEVADAVIEHRKKKRAPLTELAARGLVKAFLETGEPDAAATEMVTQGWQGFKPEYFKRQRAGPNGSAAASTNLRMEAIRDSQRDADAGVTIYIPGL